MILGHSFESDSKIPVEEKYTYTVTFKVDSLIKRVFSVKMIAFSW
jgi:hypothetical protein